MIGLDYFEIETLVLDFILTKVLGKGLIIDEEENKKYTYQCKSYS